MIDFSHQPRRGLASDHCSRSCVDIFDQCSGTPALGAGAGAGAAARALAWAALTRPASMPNTDEKAALGAARRIVIVGHYFGFLRLPMTSRSV